MVRAGLRTRQSCASTQHVVAPPNMKGDLRPESDMSFGKDRRQEKDLFIDPIFRFHSDVVEKRVQDEKERSRLHFSNETTLSNPVLLHKYAPIIRSNPRGRSPRRPAKGGSTGAVISVKFLSQATCCLPLAKSTFVVIMSFFEGKRRATFIQYRQNPCQTGARKLLRFSAKITFFRVPQHRISAA